MTSERQAPSCVVMIRPHHFRPNKQTAVDNTFQSTPQHDDTERLASAAYQEVTNAAQALREHGVETLLFEDTTSDRPDSVFPNNWFSTHSDGRISIYPMFHSNRRIERRDDIINSIIERFYVTNVVDLSHLEEKGVYLEGTGAMVLDHINAVAYAVRSKRIDQATFENWCRCFSYEPLMFNAYDSGGLPIYHTNVLMCIATKFAMISLDMIAQGSDRTRIQEKLEKFGRRIVTLTPEQVAKFAGNALELEGANGRLLVISKTAFDCLSRSQIETIENYAAILPLNVSTIEHAGGSIRCMMAGIHLKPRWRYGANEEKQRSLARL